MPPKKAASQSPEAPETHLLRIADISRDQAFQTRVKGTVPATVTRYATMLRQGMTPPPISVGLLEGRPVVLDGWHRIEAAESVGQQEITAKLFKVTLPEALRIAATANLGHGVPLSRKDLRAALNKLLDGGAHKKRGGGYRTYKDLAADLGNTLSVSTVWAWVKRDRPRIAAAMGGGSKEGAAPEPAGVTSEELAVSAFRNGLVDALAAAPGVRRQKNRQAMVAALEEAIVRVKRNAPVDLEPWDEFGPKGAL